MRPITDASDRGVCHDRFVWGSVGHRGHVRHVQIALLMSALFVALLVFTPAAGRAAGGSNHRASIALAHKKPARKLIGCRPGGSSKVFNGSGHRHEIALTFDDGPWPTPPAGQFVRVLARMHVPATFFEIGRQIPQFDAGGSVERAMLANGDMIGNHTWSHPDMRGLSTSAQRAQILGTQRAIRKRTGFTPCLWRPPYGAVNQHLVSLARSMGLLTIMWDVDPADWALPGTQAISARVVSAAHNGAIVIQHFGGGPRYETLAALPAEIHSLRARGYRFVTVAQLLGLKLLYR